MTIKLLLIDNYDSYTYNLVELLRQIVNDNKLDLELKVSLVDQLQELEIAQASHILIGPGPFNPDYYPQLFKLLDNYAPTKSIFGVCLGMQIIGQWSGAELVALEQPRHGQQTKIIWNSKLTDHDLGVFSIKEDAQVGLYHSWGIVPSSLPADWLLLGSCEAGVPMLMKHQKYSLYAVQFHPESYMSNYGKEALTTWLTQQP